MGVGVHDPNPFYSEGPNEFRSVPYSLPESKHLIVVILKKDRWLLCNSLLGISADESCQGVGSLTFVFLGQTYLSHPIELLHVVILPYTLFWEQDAIIVGAAMMP